MSWGIAETASEIEKIKSESADYLNGLNSCGVIDWNTYNYAFDFYADLLMKAYKQGEKDARPKPSKDAVSRADVVDMLEMYPFAEYSEYETAREVVKRLPSVTLKPDHIGDATEMVEYDDCVSRQAVADVAYEVGNLFDGEDDTRTPYGVAFDIQMAVDKLPSVTPKPEPCEDAVSRKSVEDVLHGYFDGMLETDTCSPKDIYGLIELLPSVAPKRKTGKWISIFDEEDSKCPICGKEYWCPETREFYFCPNCGADCRGKQDED